MPNTMFSDCIEEAILLLIYFCRAVIEPETTRLQSQTKDQVAAEEETEQLYL